MIFCQFANSPSVRDISNGVFFVVRQKSNLSFRKVRENALSLVRHQNVLIDEIIELSSPQTSGKYPKRLRRVVVYNEQKGFTVELLTNNFKWTALITILMLKYLQFKASYDWNLSNLVASLRLNTFNKMDLWKWLNEPFTPPPDTNEGGGNFQFSDFSPANALFIGE